MKDHESNIILDLVGTFVFFEAILLCRHFIKNKYLRSFCIVVMVYIVLVAGILLHESFHINIGISFISYFTHDIGTRVFIIDIMLNIIAAVMASMCYNKIVGV